MPSLNCLHQRTWRSRIPGPRRVITHIRPKQCQEVGGSRITQHNWCRAIHVIGFTLQLHDFPKLLSILCGSELQPAGAILQSFTPDSQNSWLTSPRKLLSPAPFWSSHLSSSENFQHIQYSHYNRMRHSHESFHNMWCYYSLEFTSPK